jgi:proteasome accessory factor A
MFERLAGVETEYALRFSARAVGGPRVSNAALFEALRGHLASRVPVVPAILPQNGWFLANGGGLKLERLPFYNFLPASGLVEGATPECRGPRQLLLYQRAQDVMLGRAAASSGGAAGNVVLLKSNHDAAGHYFGSHENYEATVATGIRLIVWRVALALAIPILFILVLAGELAMLLLAAPLLFLQARFSASPRAGELWAATMSWLVCLGRLPAQVACQLLLGTTAFVRLRRELLPFLVSRVVISGTGMVSRDGRFTLSPRVRTLRSLCGVTAAAWRSVFYYCHLLKALVDPEALAALFRRRQRLQLAIGDSNMAQHAEYLKIGTTLLVLDAIEAGALAGAPRLWRPLKALRTIAADPDLHATVALTGRRRWTALQIQRFYLDACRRFVERAAPEHAEARHVLKLWEETLEALGTDPARLVGKLDWVTKRYLLDRAGADAPRAARAKIDLRYHELGRDGYYMQLEAAGLAPTLVEPEQVLEATAVPPEGTPAAVRGRIIRQHAHTEAVRASWSSVVLPWGERVALSE